MLINDPSQPNDWGIKRFLVFVLSIQLAFWGATYLDFTGLHIPLLRQAVSLALLLYVPGILILRILRLHKLGSIETLLYSCGLSIAVLMLAGFAVNGLFPGIGILRPVSFVPLSVTLTVVILILCFFAWSRDRKYDSGEFVQPAAVLSPPVLFLCLLPLLSVVGTLLVDDYQNKIVLMVLMVLTALVAISIGFKKFFPARLYPLAVFSIAVSLLFHRSLISQYITGFDIHYEYYLANNVLNNGLWDWSIPVQYNTCLSVTMLGPVTSAVSGMDLTWIFKAVYPLLFSLAPLGLYRVFQKQTDPQIGFLGAFYFVLVPEFFVDLPTIMRQQIATIFLVLLAMLLVDKRLTKHGLSILLLIFGFSLIISHYGLADVFILCLISAWLLLAFTERQTVKTRLKNIFNSNAPSFFITEQNGDETNTTAYKRLLNSFFIPFFVASSFLWFVYLSGEGIFQPLVGLLNHMINGVLSSLLNVTTSGGLERLSNQTAVTPLFMVSRIMTYLVQFLIVFGVISVILKPGKMNFRKEYIALSAVNLCILFAAILVPYFTAAVDMLRLYHITLIFLAPFPVLGAIALFHFVRQRLNLPAGNRVPTFGILSIFFSIYFLFQSGFVAELAGQNRFSVALNRVSLAVNGNNLDKATLYSSVTYKEDVFSARWLSSQIPPGRKIYATFGDVIQHALLSYGGIPVTDVMPLTENTSSLPSGDFIYFQHLNVVDQLGTQYSITQLSSVKQSVYDIGRLAGLYKGKNRIYANGGSEIYN